MSVSHSVCVSVWQYADWHTGIAAAHGEGMVFFREAFNISSHMHTRTHPHVTAGGGGRGKLSTLSRNEASDAQQGQQAPGFSLGSMVVVVTGTVVALAAFGGLV